MNNKLILGTVQFGLNYGINNSVGKPNEKEVYEILDYAQKSGIRVLDTAEAYGNAIELIGNYLQDRPQSSFEIISKFKVSEGALDVNDLVNKSLKQLHSKRFFGYLYHSYDDFLKYDGLLEDLENLKATGEIKYIGVSIYTNEQFEELIYNEHIDIIQLPYNLLDNLSQRGALLKKAKERGKIIHVRSVFLQGLFFKDPCKLPLTLLPLKGDLEALLNISKDFSISIAELALSYVVSNPLIDGVLLGVDNVTQLKVNLKAFDTNLSAEVLERINDIRVAEKSLLNPSNW